MTLFRTKGRVRREAAEWVARLGGGASEEDLAAFQQWQQADRHHAEAYERIAALWSAAGQLSASRAAANDQLSTSSPRRSLVLAMAAMVVISLALGAALLGSRWYTGAGSEGPITFASAIGEIRQIELPDGSRLMLDSQSHVEARFDASTRLLILRQGRVRFIVAHEARPFIVRAASSEVVATGTVFDVSLIGPGVTVLLLEGTVDVSPPRTNRPFGVQRLHAGQKLEIADGVAMTRREITAQETRWPSQMLEFDEAPLRDAVALVNRYNRTQLRLADDSVGAVRVSGAYRAGDVAGFAHSVAAAFELDVESRPNGDILLVRRAVGRNTPG